MQWDFRRQRLYQHQHLAPEGVPAAGFWGPLAGALRPRTKSTARAAVLPPAISASNTAGGAGAEDEKDTAGGPAAEENTAGGAAARGEEADTVGGAWRGNTAGGFPLATGARAADLAAPPPGPLVPAPAPPPPLIPTPPFLSLSFSDPCAWPCGRRLPPPPPLSTPPPPPPPPPPLPSCCPPLAPPPLLPVDLQSPIYGPPPSD